MRGQQQTLRRYVAKVFAVSAVAAVLRVLRVLLGCCRCCPACAIAAVAAAAAAAAASSAAAGCLLRGIIGSVEGAASAASTRGLVRSNGVKPEGKQRESQRPLGCIYTSTAAAAANAAHKKTSTPSLCICRSSSTAPPTIVP